jgi:F0F1-type ATP synthase membrane subunit a
LADIDVLLAKVEEFGEIPAGEILISLILLVGKCIMLYSYMCADQWYVDWLVTALHVYMCADFGG